MVTIPKRAEVGQDARRGQGTRFASGADVETGVPGTSRDPGLRTSPEQFGAADGAGLQTAGEQIAQFGGQFLEAEKRIQNRKRGVEVMGAVDEFNTFVTDFTRTIGLEQDLADESVLNAARDKIQEKREEILGRFDDIETRGLAGQRIGTIESTFIDQLASDSVKAGKERVGGQFDEFTNRRAAIIAQDPSQLDEQIAGVKADVELIAGSFTPAEEQARQSAAISALGETAIDSLLRQGDFDDAEDILADPEFRSILDPETQRRLTTRISDARRNLTTDQDVKGIPRDIFDSLSPQQQAQVLGAVPDQTSIKGIPQSVFNQLSPEDQRRFLGVEAEPVISELIDPAGGVKRETSGEIRRHTAQLLGGAFDISTGQVSGLNPDEARSAQEMNAATEQIIENGEADSIAQAVALAMTRVELPEQLSFEEIADRSIAIFETHEPTEDELATAPDRVAENRESLIDLSDATGVRSGLVDAIQNNLLGQIDGRIVDTDVVKGRRRLAMLENEFISAFKRSPRLPVWEQVRLSRIFSGPSVVRSPEGMAAELRVIEAVLTTEIAQQRALLSAPVPVEMKTEALQNIISLAQFRARIADFDIEPGFRTLKTVEDVKGASLDEVVTFFSTRTDDEIDALPPEVLIELRNKMQQGQ